MNVSLLQSLNSQTICIIFFKLMHSSYETIWIIDLTFIMIESQIKFWYQHFKHGCISITTFFLDSFYLVESIIQVIQSGYHFFFYYYWYQMAESFPGRPHTNLIITVQNLEFIAKLDKVLTQHTFFMPYSFKKWAIMFFQNFLFFISLSKTYLFVIS